MVPIIFLSAGNLDDFSYVSFRYCARVDSISISGQGIDDKWRLTGVVTVHRPYKMEVKAKLETVKGAPFKWTAADNDGRFMHHIL